MQITSNVHDTIREIRWLDCKLAELIGDDACDKEIRTANKILISSLNKLWEIRPASQEDLTLITEFALEMIERDLKLGNTDCFYTDLIRKIIRIHC